MLPAYRRAFLIQKSAGGGLSYKEIKRAPDDIFTPSEALLNTVFLKLQNNLSRALCRALAAVCTLLVINECQVVIHMDSVRFTLLGT